MLVTQPGTAVGPLLGHIGSCVCYLMNGQSSRSKDDICCIRNPRPTKCLTFSLLLVGNSAAIVILLKLITCLKTGHPEISLNWHVLEFLGVYLPASCMHVSSRDLCITLTWSNMHDAFNIVDGVMFWGNGDDQNPCGLTYNREPEN